MEYITTNTNISENIIPLYLPKNLDISKIKDSFGKKWRSALMFVDYFLKIANSPQYRHQYYANINSRFLDIIVGRDYSKIINKFVDLEIFKRNDTYKVGCFSKSYRIMPEYFHSEYYTYELEYSVGAKRLIKYRKKIQKDKIAAQKFIDIKVDKIKLDTYLLNKNILNNKNVSQINKNHINRLNIIMSNPNEKNSDHFFNVRDEKTGRIYTSISNMMKESRSCLRYDGEEMVELDIKNCQPLLLSTFYDTRLEKHKKEKEKYIDIIKNDDLYEFINRRLSVPYIIRKNLKGEVYKRIFYGSLQSCSGEMWDIFSHHFPVLARIVHLNKLNLDKSGFACKMQSKESDVVIDGLMGWVMKNREDWGIIPIHDGVLIQKSKMEECQKEFLRIFKERTGLNAIISLK